MLEIQNLNYKAEGRVDIIRNYNLKFDRGITVITGHNGSGKTTLTKLIMGIIKPQSGRILLNQTDITNMSLSKRAKMGLTYAFQQPVKFKGITVKRLLDIASGEDNSIGKACDYLSMVGLCARDYLNRQLDNTLSGGELKRIELSIALAKGGEVFLFDEPEAGIDIWSFDGLINLFKSLKDKVVIIVSHNKSIMNIASSIVVLDRFNSATQGNAKEMLKKLQKNTCSMKKE